MTSHFPAKFIILFSFISSVAFLLFNQSIYSFLILLVFIVYYLVNFNNKILIYSSIILLISFTRFGFSESRDIITYSLVLLLYFIFLKEFGLNIKQYPQLPRPVLYFFILLFGTITISTLGSKNIGVSLLPYFRTLVFFSVCYIYYSFINKLSVAFIFLYMIIFAQFVIGLSIYTEFINSGFSFFLANGVMARFSGLYANPNIVGLIVIITSCIILGLFFLENFKSPAKKIFLSFLLLNNLILTILTDSRAAIIALIFCGGLMLFVFNKKVFVKVFLGSALSAFLLFLIPSINEFITILLRLEARSIRPYLWDSGYQLFLNDWLTGVGPELYKNYSFTYLPSAVINLLVDTGNLSAEKVLSPHNYVLLMASENGILGIFSVLSLYLLYFYLNIKAMIFYKSSNKDLYYMMITFFAAGIGIFWRSFFEISGIMNYGYMATDLPFWILMIVMIYLFQNKETLIKANSNRVLT
jgi:hypothetical protein